MRIAIIGTMGSGKSEALKTAAKMGIATLSADEINRELLADPNYVALLAREFPSAVKDGEADRAELARIVFSDAGARARLNALAHPRILARIESDKRDPLAVEMPLYVESGAARLFDKTLYVDCSPHIRFARLIHRGMSAEDIEARLAAQNAERISAVADVVVCNDGSLEELHEKTQKALKYLLEES